MFFFILYLLTFHLAQSGHIYTWDAQITYDIEGKVYSITLPFKLTNTLPIGAYFHFGGLTLHSTLLSEVKADITSLDGTLMETITASTTTQLSFTTHYYFQLTKTTILSEQWFNFVIKPTTTVSGLYTQILFRTISSLDDSAMIYDSSHAAAQLNIADLPSSGMSVTFTVDSTQYPKYLQPGAQYVMVVSLNTRVQVSGAQIVLQIQKGSHNDGITEEDFTILSGCSSNLLDYNCQLDGKTKVIITTTNTLEANQLTTVQLSIQNPPFVSTRDLRVMTIATSEGNRISEKGFRSNVFRSQTVNSNLNTVEYLWGIDYLEDLTNTYVGIFAAQSYNTPFNPIKISFTVSDSVNIIYPLVVQIKISAAQALNIKHNFQAFSSSIRVTCKYVSPNLECYNVGALAADTAYYISCRALYTSTSTISDFGMVSFYLQQSVVAYKLYVYGDSSGVIKTLDQDSHMLDIGGWHGPNGFLSYTQVSSIEGVTLTSSDVGKLLGSHGTVGIVPSSQSSLLFFLKTDSSQFCGASAVATDPCHSSNIQSKYLKMTILVNNQILTSNTQSLPSKMLYIAKDAGGIYQTSSFQCVGSSSCDQNKNQNSYTIYASKGTQYGVLSFECGKVTGNPTLLTDCFTLKGSAGGAGSNGIFSLPNIQYPTSFTHSSQYADENNIDFVVNFYRGDIVSGVKPTIYTRISSHLINAYTVNAAQNVKASFINYYMGNTQGNNGWYVPTMLRIKVPLSTDTFDRVTVFFDSNIKIYASGQYPSTQDCYAYDSSTLSGLTDVWYLQTAVICRTDSDILLPIIPNGLPKTIYITLSSDLNSYSMLQAAPIKVYRVFGAAVFSNVNQAIPVIGGLSTQLSDLTLPLVVNSKIFDIKIDSTSLQKITIATGPSSLDLEQNRDSYIGAGITFVAIGQNIFNNLELTSYFGTMYCLPSFSYSTTGNVNANLLRYVKFCPFDSFISYPFKGQASTLFQYPQNFQLSTIIFYAISGAKGSLYAAKSDPGTITSLLYACTLGPTNSLYPNSLGLQRIRFTIRFASSFSIGGDSYGSAQIKIILNQAITGLNIITSTTTCDIETTITLTCTYSILSNTIIVTLTSSTKQEISRNQVAILSFRIRSTYGLSTFGNSQPFTVIVLLPSLKSGQQAVYGDTYAPSPLVQEQCSYNSIKLESTGLGKEFSITNIKIAVPNEKAISEISWDFQLKSPRQFIAADTSFIMFNIGFLKDQNLINKLRCQIYDKSTNQLSNLFSKIIVSTIPRIDIYFLKDITNPHLYTFQMVCSNYKTPTNTYQTEAFTGALVDFVGMTQVLQSEVIPYDRLTYLDQSGVITGQSEAVLKQKVINSSGFGAIYEIEFMNGKFQMLQTYKINIRFHLGISPKKQRLGDISCKLQKSFCYCTQIDELIVMDVCELIEPLTKAIIIIGQIDQPLRQLWPNTALIWIGVDNDDNLSNGLYFQTSLSDIQGDDYITQGMIVTDILISSNYIRTTQNHKLTVNFPSGSITDKNTLYAQFPGFYSQQLQLASSISCNLGRQDDITNTNFATSCIIISGNVIQMTLTTDSANNLIKQYILTLSNIPLPYQLPPNPQNAYQIKLHLIQSGYTRVKFTSSFFYNSALNLVAEDKINVDYTGYSYSYNRDESMTTTKMSSIKIYKGVYKTLIKLHEQQLFSETFGYSFNTTILKTFPTSLQASSGSLSSDFLIGATPSASLGYNVIRSTKLSGGNSYVSTLPDLKVFVVEEQCQLQTDQSVYYINVGGLTQPIYIDIQECFPMNDLRIELKSDRSELEVVAKNPQDIMYDGLSLNGLRFSKYQFIFQVSNNDTYTISNGDELSMYFELSGVSYLYYIAPPNITIKFIDSSIDSPVLTFSQAALPNKNEITFYFTCTLSSTLLWVIGCGSEIIYIPQSEIFNSSIYSNHMRTQRNTSDLDWKLYGSQSIIKANDIVQEKFMGLKSASNYTLLAYCVDSVGFSSDQLVFQWQTVNNGGRTIKLNITFNSSLSSAKQLELVCGLNLIFPIDPSRIYDSKSYACTLDTLSEIESSATSTSRILQEQTSNTSTQQSYYVYIMPDQSLKQETINNEVQGNLSNLTYFQSLLENKMSLDLEVDPSIINVKYSEPDQSLQPKLNYTDPIVGSTNITMNITLSLCKGYVGIGIEQTDTSPTPSVTQLRRSQNYLNRTLVQGYLLFYNYSSQVQNETKEILFDSLSPNLKYKIYYFSSNDDAGPLQKVSEVNVIQIQTTPNVTYSKDYIIILMIVIYIFYG